MGHLSGEAAHRRILVLSDDLLDTQMSSDAKLRGPFYLGELDFAFAPLRVTATPTIAPTAPISIREYAKLRIPPIEV